MQNIKRGWFFINYYFYQHSNMSDTTTTTGGKTGRIICWGCHTGDAGTHGPTMQLNGNYYHMDCLGSETAMKVLISDDVHVGRGSLGIIYYKEENAQLGTLKEWVLQEEAWKIPRSVMVLMSTKRQAAKNEYLLANMKKVLGTFDNGNTYQTVSDIEGICHISYTNTAYMLKCLHELECRRFIVRITLVGQSVFKRINKKTHTVITL